MGTEANYLNIRARRIFLWHASFYDRSNGIKSRPRPPRSGYTDATTMHIYHLLFLALALCGVPLAMAAAGGFAALNKGGFAAFDKRAAAGERLSVVFFGASLTWGANASDQELASYRAVILERFRARYPQAHLRCWDAAIGGTGSQLGAFRLERDVLARKPDLVFVDFTANDNIYLDDAESLSSYESILRRLASAGIPVVQVAFPFRWDIDRAQLPNMKRLAAHHTLASAYGNGWGDAVRWIISGVETKRYLLTDMWVADGAHPYDLGYHEFAEAAWVGYTSAVTATLTPRVPAEPLHPGIYAHLQRFPLSSLATLPAGWLVGQANRTAINHDWLMSRWLDDLVIARNFTVNADGKPELTPPEVAPAPVAPLRLAIHAASILLFGEATPLSGKFRVRLDGKLLVGVPGQAKDADFFDANRWQHGNGHLVFELARNLDASRVHILEIEPLFAANQELRINSICVAGGAATVTTLPA